MQFRWALVDIETTGLHVTKDKITEIAVIILTEKGIEQIWSSLINPVQVIPDMITRLTGITNALVANAPYFHDKAEELQALLKGCVLVAHNARFDYGFLKNAFKAINLPLQTPYFAPLSFLEHCIPH